MIQELKCPDGRSVTNEKAILEEIAKFYKELYTSTSIVENVLLKNLKIKNNPDIICTIINYYMVSYW